MSPQSPTDCPRKTLKPEDIHERLKTSYPDGEIDVVDLTGTHDHYQVRVTSAAFAGMSRIEQQRHVMKVFSLELQSGELHALTIKTVTKN